MASESEIQLGEFALIVGLAVLGIYLVTSFFSTSGSGNGSGQGFLSKIFGNSQSSWLESGGDINSTPSISSVLPQSTGGWLFSGAIASSFSDFLAIL